jgi:4-hydroxy-4-methyl-2-oxoglutarate aldolase
MYVINRMPPQIASDLLERLASTDTGTIGHVLDVGFMDPGLRATLPRCKIAGTAVTVRSTLPDSAIGHYALKWLRPNDILVIERGQDQRTACWGGSTSTAAKRMGLAGLIMDGVGNDLEQSNDVGFPIWCRGSTPVTTKYRSLGGEMNVAISCGGVAVNPGDAILADGNGVIVMRPEQLPSILDAALASQSWERDFLANLLAKPHFCYPDESGSTKIVEDNLDPRSTIQLDSRAAVQR